MDINSVVAENKGAGVLVVPTPGGQDRGSTEHLVKPVATVTETVNGAMEDKALQARQQSNNVVSQEDAAKYAKEIQVRLDQMGSNLQFAVDDKTDSVVFQLTSKDDGRVIRQIPSEDVLELRSRFDDLLGMMFDKRV